MDQKTYELINKFKNNRALAENLLQSQDGQKLLSLLTGRDGGSSLEHATQQAAAGNTSELTQMLSNLMRSPEGAALMKRITDAARK